MPLTFVDVGKEHRIIHIKGQDKIVSFLERLGFVEGTMLMVVSFHGGNVIVKIKESRVALSQEMAQKIIVEGV